MTSRGLTAADYALFQRQRERNDRLLRRQYIGDAADRALVRLKDAYASDLISIETLESVTEDIVHGRPTRLPLLPLRNPGKPEWR